MRLFLSVLPLACLLTAIQAPAARPAATLIDKDWKAARPSGPAVDCVGIAQIRNTRVRDDRTIDFILSGGKVLRNTLPYACSRLGFEEAFSYQTSISQLCSVDIITVIPRGGAGIPGPSCGLGKFQPIVPAK